jgi:hypothetical protein
MNPGTVYFKTDKGRAEVAGRSGQVNPAQRRILMLIESGGHEEVLPPPAAPGFAAPASATEAPRPATSVEEFAKVRGDAAAFVTDRLGAAGAPISGAIERCKSPEELRRLLRGVEAFVGQRLDAETAQSFARHFGKLLL